MKIQTLHKRGLSCACGCKAELPRMDLVNKMNGKYYQLHCARIYRLHVGVIRWIKGVYLAEMQSVQV